MLRATGMQQVIKVSNVREKVNKLVKVDELENFRIIWRVEVVGIFSVGNLNISVGNTLGVVLGLEGFIRSRYLERGRN